jgi:hypothetical protein
MFPFWQEQFEAAYNLIEKIVTRLVPPKIQDRWQQGASAIIATYTIVRVSLGSNSEIYIIPYKQIQFYANLPLGGIYSRDAKTDIRERYWSAKKFAAIKA